jgi:hypothetical protein
LARTLSLRPVHGQVLAQVLGEFVGDLLEGLVGELAHRRFVVGQRVVEADSSSVRPSSSPRLAAAWNFLAISISSSMTWAVSMARFW